jgi:threonine dehydrogenase-like Zn-dependent dehydrogenase
MVRPRPEGRPEGDDVPQHRHHPSQLAIAIGLHCQHHQTRRQSLFDKQIQLRMGQANVKKWVPDIMPLLTAEDPLGVEQFATHRLPLNSAPDAYETFQKKQDGMVKVVLKP